MNMHKINKFLTSLDINVSMNDSYLTSLSFLHLVCFQRELLAAAVSSPPAWELCVQLGNTDLQQILNSPCAHSVSSFLISPQVLSCSSPNVVTERSLFLRMLDGTLGSKSNVIFCTEFGFHSSLPLLPSHNHTAMEQQ